MRLYWSSRSPFVRKVMVVAHEKSLMDRITIERVLVAAIRLSPTVMRDNPLNKIPTLMLDDGSTLFDSRVICEYLEGAGGGPSLFPAGAARWAALRLQAIGDGLMEVVVLRWGERNRPAELQSAPHHAAFAAKIAATLDRLEQETEELARSPLHIGGIAIACALSHLDFRFATDDWRQGHPALSAWHAGMRQRPSMQATEFRDEY